MTASHLPDSFALQSQASETIFVAGVLRHAGGVALLVESRRYPETGAVRLDGLLPGRHYLLAGAAHRFARADAVGGIMVELRLAAPTLVAVAPVV